MLEVGGSSPPYLPQEALFWCFFVLYEVLLVGEFYVKNKNAVFSRFLEVKNAKNNFTWVKIGLKNKIYWVKNGLK